MSTTSPTELRSFSFSATLKINLPDSPTNRLATSYPGISTVGFQSRSFGDYETCTLSCRELMDHLLLITEDDARLKLGAEVNPVFNGGQVTLSKDWAPGEVSRFWIYDRSMENSGQIHAVGQARIFGSTTPIQRQLSS